jgi:hypothetical protein
MTLVLSTPYIWNSYFSTTQIYTACLSPNLAWAEGGVGLADQMYRFRKLQIGSGAGGFWGNRLL